MALGTVQGNFARTKPKDLMVHLGGLIAISQPPTADSIIRGPLQTPPLAGTQSTQDLLAGLAASTQLSVKSASSPDSQTSRKSVGGKFPRSQSPQAQPAPLEISSDAATSSDDDEGDDEEEEDELPSAQPTPVKPKKRKPVPPEAGAHPATKLAQQTMGQMFPAANPANKKRKIPKKDGSDEPVKFSGGNLTLQAMTQFFERAFIANAGQGEGKQPESPAPETKKRKGGRKTAKVAKAPAEKATSCATTEQKGTPLFMNDTYCFC
jgi:hypothetical protein